MAKYRILARQAVTAASTPAAVSLSGMTAGIGFYEMHVCNDGANIVHVLKTGASGATSGTRIPADGKTYVVGPLAVADGAPLLYASGNTACVVTLYEIVAD